jgi:hypothetical protein
VLDDAARSYLLETLTTLFNTGQTADNGRFVRNVFQRCVEVQANRISHAGENAGKDLNTLTTSDVSEALTEVLKDIPSSST